MSIAYGIKIGGFDDPYIVNIEESIEGFNAAGIPGSFLVDLIPALKHVPSWFPGAEFKRKAAHWAAVNQKVVELPFNHVIQQMVNDLSYFDQSYYHISVELYVIEGRHGRSKPSRRPDHSSADRKC